MAGVALGSELAWFWDRERPKPGAPLSPEEGETIMRLDLTSSAFANGEQIPVKYTGEGEDVSPPLKWAGAPEETREFVLVVDDPDAPMREPWVHWLAYGIPPSVTSLPEGKPGESLAADPPGMREGETSFGSTGYGGPAPPPGHGVHRYSFKVYALDAQLDLPAGTVKADVMHAMRGHVLAKGELFGTYQR